MLLLCSFLKTRGNKAVQPSSCGKSSDELIDGEKSLISAEKKRAGKRHASRETRRTSPVGTSSESCACACILPARLSFAEILGFHSRDEPAMLVYKTMAKCRSSFA